MARMKLALLAAAGAGAAYLLRRRGADESAEYGRGTVPPPPAVAASEPAPATSVHTEPEPPVRPSNPPAGAEATEGDDVALATAATDVRDLKPAEGTDQVVMPDTSGGDPLVDEQTAAAAAEAGSVGGNVQQMADDEPGFPEDPAMRPVVEGAGEEPETLEDTDAELGGNRQTRE